jgi:adenosylcobinamide-phosphate synthase
VCLVSGGLAAFLSALPFGLGTVASVYLAWTGLALGGLIRQGQRTLESVEAAENDPGLLEKARTRVQMLVSRDTSAMNADDLYRSLAESVSENLNDAFVAPFFWLCLTGPTGLWVYRAASTLDSMWGYKNEDWIHLGRASARADDALAFLPARLCVGLMLVAAWAQNLPRRFSLIGKKTDSGRNGFFTVPGWPGWPVIAAQAGRMDSPNAGWPMTTAAWLFDGRCGGPTPYEGEMRKKPLLGPEHGRWQADNCRLLLAHARVAGLIALVFSLLFL